MTGLTFAIALALSLLAIGYVLRPLLDSRPMPIVPDDDRLTELLARKDSVMTAIKDLEFDYRLGKLTEADYQRYDQRLRRQAIAYMKQIEAIAPESTEMDATLEAEVARRRKTNAAGAPRPPETILLCPDCHQPIDATHKFCPHCGASVTPDNRIPSTDNATQTLENRLNPSHLSK